MSRTVRIGKGTGKPYSLCFLDLDGLLGENSINTSTDEILTVRIPKNGPISNPGYVELPSPKSFFIDLEIKPRHM
jgi:hypothetical protein